MELGASGRAPFLRAAVTVHAVVLGTGTGKPKRMGQTVHSHRSGHAVCVAHGTPSGEPGGSVALGADVGSAGTTEAMAGDSTMQMIPLNSSAIEAVGYDAASRRMHIKFREGGTYTFCGVPQSIFEGLTSAASAGQFYNQYIRDRYQC